MSGFELALSHTFFQMAPTVVNELIRFAESHGIADGYQASYSLLSAYTARVNEQPNVTIDEFLRDYARIIGLEHSPSPLSPK